MLGMLPDTFAELIGELLGGELQGFIARAFTRDANGIAEMNRKTSRSYSIDEARQ